MFVLGHVGIGGTLGEPLTRPRDLRWMLFGTVLPDLIDKPLYYGLSLYTGLHGRELGIISGTRTVGHTLLFLLLVWALFRRRGAALAIGMATHLLLDALGDLVGLFSPLQIASVTASPPTLAAIFYPLLGWRFPFALFLSLREHLLTLRTGYVIAGELIGAALIVWHWRRARKARATAAS